MSGNDDACKEANLAQSNLRCMRLIDPLRLVATKVGMKKSSSSWPSSFKSSSVSRPKRFQGLMADSKVLVTTVMIGILRFMLRRRLMAAPMSARPNGQETPLPGNLGSYPNMLLSLTIIEDDEDLSTLSIMKDWSKWGKFFDFTSTLTNAVTVRLMGQDLGQACCDSKDLAFPTPLSLVLEQSDGSGMKTPSLKHTLCTKNR